MVVNTRRLFTHLLSALRVDTVCDIGSLDGSDALAFRRARPAARVFALEPNPENLRRMRANPALQRCGIRIAPLAAAERDGEAEFFLVQAHDDHPAHRGMSSLYERCDPWAPPGGVVTVRTVRVDTFLAGERPGMRLALWIDVEGKAHEVIQGAAGRIDDLYLLHVEVETTPCIGANQRLYPDVKALLWQLGFFELATDQPRGSMQFNALFVRCGLPAAVQWRVRACAARASVRRAALVAARRLCPACVRRLKALRMNLSSRDGYSTRGTSRAS